MVLILKRFTVLTFCLITACSALETKESELSNSTLSREHQQELQRLFVDKKYVDAIVLLKKLIPSAGENSRIFLRLQLAQALFLTGRLEECKQVLTALRLLMLSVQQQNQVNLLYSQIYLQEGEAEQAANALDVIDINRLRIEQKRLYHELALGAYAMTGRLIESVYQRIALDTFLVAGEKKEDNKIAILQVLSSMPPKRLKRDVVSKKVGIYSGWVELSYIEQSLLRGSSDFNTALDYWQQQYPEHPANSLIISGYFSKQHSTVTAALGEVEDIAVFLPESGVYAGYANAIKAGFKAAYYQGNKQFRANIHCYDTNNGMNINELYRQAVSDGVQLIIGPLNKKLIKTLALESNLSVPVLALNYVEQLAVNNLYQFSLSPIDEVNQIVKEAAGKGYENALIMAPDSLYGRRIVGYFKAAWSAYKGRVLAVQYFKRNLKDFSKPVKKFLTINQSEQRHKWVEKVLGKIAYNPRRRHDVDMIFMVSDYREARLINPQFYHHRGGDVPVYSLSNLYKYKNIVQNIDLNGIQFCSEPWLFDSAYHGPLSREKLPNLIRQFPKKLNLIAFGLDAYGLVPYLSQLSSVTYRGATGLLSLDNQYRITRELVCAQFSDGIAHIQPVVNNL